MGADVWQRFNDVTSYLELTILFCTGSDLTGVAWRIYKGPRLDAEGKPCVLSMQL
jgi:hypothetical protein